MTYYISALEAARAIQQGDVTSTHLVETALKRIQAQDAELGAYLQITAELALETAAKVDAKVKAGESLPLLAGVPIAFKDNILVKGSRTTCASRILENFESPYDATVTRRAHAHLMPIIGKTNMDEFAMGSSNENSAFKVCRNPWALDRVPGGSSGGSAATLAAGQVPLSLGSDTGGSVRQPASFCGIVGLKPTYGLVSRFGLVAFGSSLDQISPYAMNTPDLAALMNVIAGFDPNDSTSLQLGEPEQPVDYLKELDKPLDVKRVGYIQELMGDDIEPSVRDAIQQSIKTFESMGIEVQPVSLPHIKYAVAAYYIIATAEASANLARYDGVRFGHRKQDASDMMNLYLNSRSEGFGPEVKRRIILGTFTLSSGYYDAYYGKAQHVRALLRKDFADVFKTVDLVIGPTVPMTAFKIGEKCDDPVQMYLSDVATIPINMAGVPAMSLPCGFDENKLPIGVQLIGPHLSEPTLLRLAKTFEDATGYKNQLPQAYQPQPVGA